MRGFLISEVQLVQTMESADRYAVSLLQSEAAALELRRTILAL